MVAGVISDQKEARAKAQQQEERVQTAWVREHARVEAAATKEKARQQRRDTKEQEIADGRAEADAVTRTLQGQLTGLRKLLASTLDEDPYLPFDWFKEPVLASEFRPPESLAAPAPVPQEDEFMLAPLTGLAALSPGRKRAHTAAAAQRRADYERAVIEHAATERSRMTELDRAQATHDESVRQEHERVERQHAAVERMAVDFAAGKSRAVGDYFQGVLAVQRYPSGFPMGAKVAYKPVGRELQVDIDLPLMTAIPELESAEYLVIKKELKHKKLTTPARSKLYRQVVAQMALRTLRCVFIADRDGAVSSVACNGYVDTVDTATGLDAHICLVSVLVDRAEFERLDLSRVDPLDCLAYLHAKFSQTPEKYQPVQPIIEYPWDDLHYSDETDAVADIDSVQNLLDLDGYEFEDLVLKLFRAIPEFDEVRRTRTRADGGIDLVAVNTTQYTGGRVAIQAKRYAPHRKVDIAAVREIIGSITQREFTHGIIITTSTFTKAAREEAGRLGVQLYDGEHLLWQLKNYLHREYTIIAPERRTAPIKRLPAT